LKILNVDDTKINETTFKPIINPTTEPITTTTTTERISTTTKPTDSFYPGPDVCGKIGAAKRIIGGTKAGRKEFPWLALLRYKNKGIHVKFAGIK